MEVGQLPNSHRKHIWILMLQSVTHEDFEVHIIRWYIAHNQVLVIQMGIKELPDSAYEV